MRRAPTTPTENMPQPAQTPYEAHVTMLIKTFSACVYGFLVMSVMDSALSFILYAATHLKPTCFLSLGLQLWFGMVTFFMVKEALRFLRLMFFFDACKDAVFEAMAHEGNTVQFAAESGKPSTAPIPKGPTTPDSQPKCEE